MISLNSARKHTVFIMLSIVSAGLLCASFTYPLQNMEVWKQRELTKFKQPADKIFVITDADLSQPDGLNRARAVKISQIYQDYKYQKLALLVACLLGSSIAMLLADKAVSFDKADRESSNSTTLPAPGGQTASKEFLLSRIKERWHLLTKEQKKLLIKELKLILDFIAVEQQKDKITQGDKTAIADKFIEASYLIESGTAIDDVITKLWKVEKETLKHEYIRQELVQWLKK